MRWLGGLARNLFSGAYGAAAPAMLNYFKPAPAPANGAPLPAEAGGVERALRGAACSQGSEKKTSKTYTGWNFQSPSEVIQFCCNQ